MKTKPPKQDEFELSLFGPGVGECIVIHAGNGEWLVVDSCLSGLDNKPIAVEYLQGLEVDIKKQLKLILVSHWHDDHIRGVADLIAAAPAARFACSAALRYDEFLTMVTAGAEISLRGTTSGVSELHRVMEILNRRDNGRYRKGPDCFASEGTCVYRQENPYHIKFEALSPSAQTELDAKGELAEYIPEVGQAIGRFPAIGPNDMSVALLFRSSNVNILLGADLGCGKDDTRGWRAVLNSRTRSKIKSQAYKISHHGAASGDHPDIWERLLIEMPYAIMTPYARGKSLPSQGDVARMKNRTDKVYITAWPATMRPVRRSREVERTLREILPSPPRQIRRRPGHIRYRVPLNGANGPESIELFDGGVKL